MALFGKKNNEIPEEQNIPAETPAQTTEQNKVPDFDFNRYFLAERRVFLENISYETTKPEAGAQGYKLTGKDTVVAQVLGNTGVKIT